MFRRNHGLRRVFKSLHAPSQELAYFLDSSPFRDPRIDLGNDNADMLPFGEWKARKDYYPIPNNGVINLMHAGHSRARRRKCYCAL